MTETISGIIFDIDGVLEYQGKVYPHAVETIRAVRERGFLIRFLTNSTLKSRASCARKLRGRGFMVSDDEVFTASYLTAGYLRRIRPRSCWVMLDGDGRDEFREFPQDREHPEYIVMGDNRSCFDFNHLNKALQLLLQGSLLIGMQAERIDTDSGEVELNVGSWVGMLERASGVPALYIGKPNAFAFELPVESMKLPNDRVAVVGDRLATDIVGAQRLGVCTVLIRTGEFRPRDLEEDVHPDFIIDGIAQLAEVLSGF